MEWFAIEIDRKFESGNFGNGNEIYIKIKNDNDDFIKLKHGVIKS